MLKVQRRMCATCIYRPGTPLNIAELERQVADPRMAGHFRGFRECHHARRGSGVCCRGFWERHKDRFDAGQLAQRLGIVRYVDEDTTEERTMAKRSTLVYKVVEALNSKVGAWWRQEDVANFCGPDVTPRNAQACLAKLEANGYVEAVRKGMATDFHLGTRGHDVYRTRVPLDPDKVWIDPKRKLIPKAGRTHTTGQLSLDGGASIAQVNRMTQQAVEAALSSGMPAAEWVLDSIARWEKAAEVRGNGATADLEAVRKLAAAALAIMKGA